MATTAGLLLTLPQMVDLAIGSPEIGAVNFTLLGVAIQVMIQQMNLNEFVVDYRSSEMERMQALVATAKPEESLQIHEVEEVEASTVPAHKGEDKASDLQKTNKMIVVEQQNKKKKGESLPQVVVGVSQDLFVQLNNDVAGLKSRMNEILEIPNNDTIMEAIRAEGQDKVTPVIDMWHALQISKRIDTAEAGMEKISGMFEDLVRDVSKYGGVKDTENAEDEEGEEGTQAGPRMSFIERIEKRIDALEQAVASGGVGGGEEEEGGEPVSQNVSADLESLKSKFKTVETDFNALMKGAKGKTLAEIFKEIEELKGKLAESGDAEEGGKGAGVNEAVIEEIQEKFNEQSALIQNLDENLSAQIKQLQEQLLNVEKELGALLETSNTKTDNAVDAASMGDMYNKMLKQQEEIDALNKIADRLIEEQDERTLAMESLTEQVELLKTRKANREDLEEALADKADTQQMNRKVSTMQFDAACEDMTRHIEDTMTKLTEQEQMWQNTMTEIQMLLGGKLDRQEFDPLKDFVNKKIKSLQHRLKALLAMKQEQEAAGTKSKLLKDVNCISCDKDVVMYKENKFSTFPVPASMPGSKSIKPYITYELDAIRKQQKSLPQGRNMNHLESALHEEKPRKDKSSPPDKAIPAGHLCNRYCGGSHTMTLPQQRVGHIGHFLNQWGPHAIPLDEGQVMGTDGQMYKARDSPGVSPKSRKDRGRTSAQIQTEEPPERVPRMSSKLEQMKAKPKKPEAAVKEEGAKEDKETTA